MKPRVPAICVMLSAAASLAIVNASRGAAGERKAAPPEPLPQQSTTLSQPLELRGVVNAPIGPGSDLLKGISGEGTLTLEQIDAWLAEPGNHTVIRPKLPMGLAAGQRGVQGVEENPLTRAKIELGRQLFFDKRLSADNTVSCASCHAPDKGYAQDTRFGVGIRKQEGDRNAPAAYNRILSGPQFRDGRAASLEAQAVGPIENALEMGSTHGACVESLRGIPGYRRQFDELFDDGVTIENVGRAIACFERVVVTGPSPWDYHEELRRFEESYRDELSEPEFFEEDEPELYAEHLRLLEAAKEHPVSESAIRGGALFFDDATGCSHCHNGVNYSDEDYHNLGVGMGVKDPAKIDWGRHKVTEHPADRGAFKTPTLRNVALTAPYMHDGSLKTLEQVVDWYNQGGRPNAHLSEVITKLKLTAQQKADLVAFMKSLTGPLPEVEEGRLPE